MPLKFLKAASSQPAVRHTVEAIVAGLEAGRPVLWLLSGGSSIPWEVDVAREVCSRSLNNGLLTISLTDERPGPLGHPDSNWHLLMQAGFQLPGAATHPVLLGGDPTAEAAAFDRFLRAQFERHQITVANIGMGPDGHVAGLPHTHAASSEAYADYYEAGTFRRISMTPKAIALLDEVVCYVSGPAKADAIERLDQDLPYEAQSAQAIKHARKVTVYNDLKGELAT